ncbi:MSMEG_0567/Sll0786 family nitrogen starvation N-acetyltransferase [Nitrobacter sp. 62-23]|uniref:MSMEG_0567/Sll0786 family nitrogen starvation N-acetyltransferase n=1 Tax=Nitrobacter sp. 62-23 TaxID=1895798 RepID=UPI00092C7E02|nr:MSMEG_0567/Sll0786 family nitrogen starvation N-acetyltransferase [Nitrobacter sp. 62-23]OJV01730.1 MAG: histone acetyltransferase [Nitrobacter sp. 62-23]
MSAVAKQAVPAPSLRIKWATAEWERSAAFALRREIFCEEQGVFVADDRDEIDEFAIALVAVMQDEDGLSRVVGTVRIHEDLNEHKTWWGSRLAVTQAYRGRAGGRIGPDLIRLAVSSAHARGCTRFLANVQSQNALLFKRLHWRSLEEFDLFGRAHHRMEADLEYYPPFGTPQVGFLSRAR